MKAWNLASRSICPRHLIIQDKVAFRQRLTARMPRGGAASSAQASRNHETAGFPSEHGDEFSCYARSHFSLTLTTGSPGYHCSIVLAAPTHRICDCNGAAFRGARDVAAISACLSIRQDGWGRHLMHVRRPASSAAVSRVLRLAPILGASAALGVSLPGTRRAIYPQRRHTLDRVVDPPSQLLGYGQGHVLALRC